MTELVRDPLYSQLNELLRAMITRGEFACGTQFLTERQVSQRFGVSRATANKALAAMVAEGTLEFRKGVGTFVREARLDYDLRALVSFTEKARAAGKTPTTRVLCLERQEGESLTEEAALALGREAVWYMERLRLADGVPVILECRSLLERWCPGLDREAVSGSLYELFTERFGLTITGADETIQAISLSEEEAELLEMPSGEAALCITAVGLIKGDTPLWFERTLYRGDAYEIRNRVGPLRQSGPAAGQLIREGGSRSEP